MTGTSVDGLDLALIKDSPAPEILAGRTYPLPERLRGLLLQFVHNDPNGDIDQLGYADAALGDFIGETVLTFLNDEGIAPSTITAIGSHGQTIRHRPTPPNAFTLQIGDPHRVAEITGITTVADFRRRDVAAGGQGAPLVPAFHRAIFASPSERRVVLNIGGIANVTALLPDEKLSGFDTGPGNGLMDLWTQEHLLQPMDTNGAWASSGVLDHVLLSLALEDPYFHKPHPKSTGREYFNREWLNNLLQRRSYPLDPVVVQATLAALVARSITLAINSQFGAIDKLIVCGGGRRNAFLLRLLRESSGYDVLISEDLGVDGDSLEAAAFAWFGARALFYESAGDPTVTGARVSRVLGVIFPGAT